MNPVCFSNGNAPKLIITNIGSAKGFVENDSLLFEEYFEQILGFNQESLVIGKHDTLLQLRLKENKLKWVIQIDTIPFVPKSLCIILGYFVMTAAKYRFFWHFLI